MSATVITNRPKLPAGYRVYSAVAIIQYNPFNGAKSAFNPGLSQFGATQDISVSAVPADLSLLVINGPDGKAYTFQFVYNASVWSAGIKVPLPNSGASTAAQVSAALTAVMNATFGTSFGGVTVPFPWTAAQTAAAVTTLSWTIAGSPGAPTLPAGIGNVNTQGGFGRSAVVPAMLSPGVFAFLPTA